MFLPDLTMMKPCLLIGLYSRRSKCSTLGGEAGPLREGDELILMSQTPPGFFRGCGHPTPPSLGTVAADSRDAWWTPRSLYSHGTTRVGMDHCCVFCLFGGRSRSCAWYRPTAATPRHRHGDSSRDRCSHARGVRHFGNVVARLDAAGVHPARLLASSSPGDQHEPGL